MTIVLKLSSVYFSQLQNGTISPISHECEFNRNNIKKIYKSTQRDDILRHQLFEIKKIVKKTELKYYLFD